MVLVRFVCLFAFLRINKCTQKGVNLYENFTKEESLEVTFGEKGGLLS